VTGSNATALPLLAAQIWARILRIQATGRERWALAHSWTGRVRSVVDGSLMSPIENDKMSLGEYGLLKMGGQTLSSARQVLCIALIASSA
jgi:hypothetical protein